MPLELIVVGASLGGLDAIRRLLSSLPADFRVPIALVQHRSVYPDVSLCAALQAVTPLVVVEASDKAPIAEGHVYFAPQDYHLLVDAGSFALSTEDKVQRARPSIDVLFESAAYAYGSRVAGVVLTGASRDGAEGARAILSHGGRVLAEDPAVAESPLMPRSAIEVGAESVPALHEIGTRLVSLAHTPEKLRRASRTSSDGRG